MFHAKNCAKTVPILASGNMDLYIGFLYKCIQQLSPSGTLVAIVPNSWLYNVSSASFRRAFIRIKLIREIHDYGSEKVFKDFNVYCCIIVIDHTEKTCCARNNTIVPYSVKIDSDARTLGQHVKMRNGAQPCAIQCLFTIRQLPTNRVEAIYKVSKDQERHVIYPYDGRNVWYTRSVSAADARHMVCIERNWLNG